MGTHRTSPVARFFLRRKGQQHTCQPRMSQLLNRPYDAFADVGDETPDQGAKQQADKGAKGERAAAAGAASYVHIRIQQRNGRKTITTLQGTPTEYDIKKLLKAFKKEFACNGSIVDDDEMGQVIQLQGDQRTKIYQLLTEEGIKKETIKIHGF